MGPHPTAAELAELITGRLSHERSREVVRHLLGGCAACRAVIAPQMAVLLGREIRVESDETEAAPPPPGAAHAPAIPAPAPSRPGPPSRTRGRAGAQTSAAARDRRSAVRPVQAIRSNPPAPLAPIVSFAPLASVAPLAPRPLAAAAVAPTVAAARSAGDGSPRPPLGSIASIAVTPADDLHERAIDQACAAVARHGRNTAREAAKVRQVLAILEERGLAGFRNLPGHLRGPACYEALLARSWALRFDDPKQMVQLAELATVVAANLSTRRCGREQVRDCQCRAAIELANAHRVSNQLHEAQGCLNEAIDLFRRGSQDRLLGARLFVVQGLVLGARRSFESAFAAFDGALAVYRLLGQPHQVADTLITRGMYTGIAGRSEEALALLHEALAMLDPAAQPALVLFAIHNIAMNLIDLGRFREARTLIWRHMHLYHRHGGESTRLRLRWLEARIHAGVGELDRAERAFRDVRQGFAESGKPYQAALVLLDLAVLAMRQGRDAQARSLALEAAEVFLSLEIGREATVAMMLLKSTVKLRVATTSLLFEEMAKFMSAAENDPKATFHSYLT